MGDNGRVGVEMTSESHVLEIASGSGRYALQVAATTVYRFLSRNAGMTRGRNELKR